MGDLLRNLVWVGLGSCLGGTARYLISVAIKPLGGGFPWGTLTVNLAGCFLIGLLCGLFQRNGSSESVMALFCTVGLCGGFTTFSTFSREAFVMLQSAQYGLLIAYVGISLVAGVALTALGYLLTH